jgi:hypothetical protein
MSSCQNIGAFRNVQAVLGPNPLLWLWPQEMQGDGLSFPVNPEAGGESSEAWAGVVARDRAQGSASRGPVNGSAGQERYRGRRGSDIV